MMETHRQAEAWGSFLVENREAPGVPWREAVAQGSCGQLWTARSGLST